MGGSAGGGDGQTSIPATQSGGGFASIMNNPFMQGGLAMMANNTGREGENGYMAGLGAFNRAQAYNNQQSMLGQQEERRQKEFGFRQKEQDRRDEALKAMPEVMRTMLDAETEDEMKDSIVMMSKHNPQMAMTMLNSEKKGETSMIKNFEFLQSLPDGKKKTEFKGLLMKAATQININDKALGAKDLKDYQHRITGETPKPGTTNKEIISGDYVVKTEKPINEAARRTMANQAIDAAMSIRSQIIDKDGELNRMSLAKLSIPGTELYSKFQEAIASNIYLKSGSEAPAGEVDRQIGIYKPRIWASSATAGDQLSRLIKFFEQTSLETGSPAAGTTDSPAADSSGVDLSKMTDDQKVEYYMKKYGAK